MAISIAIITAPRTSAVDYLDASIVSLRKASFQEEIHIFAEPLSFISETRHWNCKIHCNEKRKGCCDNWLFALRYLLDNTTNDWFMVCEDDFVCTENSKQVIQDLINTLDKPIGYISGFTSNVYFNLNIYKGEIKDWIEWNPGMIAHGSQCYVMPRASAELLLSEADEYFNKFEKYKEKNMGVDFIVSTFFEIKNLPCYYPIPSLFDHTGIESTTESSWHQGYLFALQPKTPVV